MSADSIVHVLSLSGFCPDFCKKTVQCLSVRILSVSILSAIRILSGIREKTLSAGRGTAIRTFGVLVRRRLLSNFFIRGS